MDNLFRSLRNKAGDLIDTVKKKGENIVQSIKKQPEEFFSAVTADDCGLVKRSLHWVILVNEKNPFGNTPLHIAAINGSREMADLLIAWGARVNERDDEGCTALIRAAEGGHEEVVKLLLSTMAEIGAADNKGATALHCAAGRGQRGIVELLASYGAFLNLKDYQGRLPRDYAAEGGHGEIVTFLETHGAREKEARDKASQKRALEKEELLRPSPMGKAAESREAPGAKEILQAPMDEIEKYEALKAAGHYTEACHLAEMTLQSSVQQGLGLPSLLWIMKLIDLYAETAQYDRMKQLTGLIIPLMNAMMPSLATAFLIDAARIYREVNDIDSARLLLKTGLEIAQKDPAGQDTGTLREALAKLEAASG
ncbi:MAG: ankyrin repeat domain-containing protein [Candidatus Eremiobacteraeota bacterium]|nr:ankyrin repeat domain-containing protein [Candidatus Eremiobacteraeota bacterium]